jgi:hypothetical protein
MTSESASALITAGAAVAMLAIVLVAVKLWNLRARRRRRKLKAARREHERLTGWFPAIKTPGSGPAILRDDNGTVVLYPALVKGSRWRRGQHRGGSELTSRPDAG